MSKAIYAQESYRQKYEKFGVSIMGFMMSDGNNTSIRLSCERCGKCCLEWGAYFVLIAEEDIERWKTEGRSDIFQYLEFLEGNIAFGWINPQTKEKLSRCPFLLYEIGTSRYLCKIHNTKPKRCKDYYCTLGGYRE